MEGIPTSICVESLQCDTKQDIPLAVGYQQLYRSEKRRGSLGKHSSSKYDNASSACPTRPTRPRRKHSEQKQTSSKYDRASLASPTPPERSNSRDSDRDRSLVENQQLHQPMKRRGSLGKQSSSEYGRASPAAYPTRPQRISSRDSDRDRTLVGHKQQHQPPKRRSSLGGRQSASEYVRVSSPTRPRRSISGDSNDTYNRGSPPPLRTNERRMSKEEKHNKKNADAGARVPSKICRRLSGGKKLTEARGAGRHTVEHRTRNENLKSGTEVVRRSSKDANNPPPTNLAFRDARAPKTYHEPRLQSSRHLESEQKQQQRLGEALSNAAHNPSSQSHRHRNSLGEGSGDNARHISFGISASSLNHDTLINGEFETFQKRAMRQERLQQAKGAYHVYRERSQMPKAVSPAVVADGQKIETNGADATTPEKKWGGLGSLLRRRNCTSSIIVHQDDRLIQAAGRFGRYKEGQAKGCTTKTAGATPGTHHMDVELPVQHSDCQKEAQRKSSMPTNLREPSKKNAVQQGEGGRRDGLQKNNIFSRSHAEALQARNIEIAQQKYEEILLGYLLSEPSS